MMELCVSSDRDEEIMHDVPAEVKLALNVDHPNIVRLLQHACRLSRQDCNDGVQVHAANITSKVLLLSGMPSACQVCVTCAGLWSRLLTRHWTDSSLACACACLSHCARNQS